MIKSNKKFKSAKTAKLSRELEKSWNDLLAKYPPKMITSRKTVADYLEITNNSLHRIQNEIPSRVTPGDTSFKRDAPKYTGTAIIGISTMHKSNAIPVFSKEQAIEISKMRRG